MRIIDVPNRESQYDGFVAVGQMTKIGLDIEVLDVNDNAPDLYTVPDPAIFSENVPPEQQRPQQVEAIAFDRDSAELNGLKPYKLVPINRADFQDKFSVEWNPGTKFVICGYMLHLSSSTF